MSFIHRLTIGFLDGQKVQVGQTVVLRPLPEGFLEMIAALAPEKRKRLQAADFAVHDGYVTCNLFSPSPHVASVWLAYEAKSSFGLTVADIRHCELMTLMELRRILSKWSHL